MVGILRAGGAYVPLDPKLPVDRLQYLVEQCKCEAVVAQKKFEGNAGAVGVDVVVAEDVLYDNKLSSQFKPDSNCGPESLAYVLFTSGSTGKPKGVMIQHSSLVAFITHTSVDGPYKALADELSYVRLYVLAFTFDDSVGVVWRTLVTGAELVIGKPDAWLDPDYLQQTLFKRKVTSMWGVPSPFTALMEVSQGRLPESLVDLHLSGEALPPYLVANILTNPNVTLFNPYGPAEVTINSHAHKCSEEDGKSGSVPIGHALPNTTGFVLMASFAVVKIEEVTSGETCTPIVRLREVTRSRGDTSTSQCSDGVGPFEGRSG